MGTPGNSYFKSWIGQSHRNLPETRWNPVWTHCLNVQNSFSKLSVAITHSVSDTLLKNCAGEQSEV